MTSRLLAAAGLLLMVATSVARAQENTELPPALPEFSLQALQGGSYVSKERLAGQLAIVSFWRLDQEYSIRLLKDLVRLREEPLLAEVEVVTIVAGPSDRARVGQLVEELGVRFPVLFDPDRSLYAELDVIVSPSTWFVDGRGELRFSYPGHRRDFLQVVRANIEQLRGRITEEERRRRGRSGAAPGAGGEGVGPAARYRLALKLLARGDRPAGEKQLRKAWETEPGYAKAGVELGLLLLEQGRDEEALEITERALGMSPEVPRAIGAKGLAYIRAGRNEKGEELLREAIARGARQPLFFYEMALLSERLGVPDDARRYYKRGLELMLEERRMDGGLGLESSDGVE